MLPENEPLESPGKYLLESVIRACDVLQAFRFDGEILRLRDIVVRTGLNKTTVFRIVRSLEQGRLIEAVPPGRYRLLIRPIPTHRMTVGYAAQGSGLPFSRELTASIVRAAEAERVTLVNLSNEYSPKTALRNVDRLIKARVDLVIEHQIFDEVAPLIAAKFREARIPMIAVAFPHPGAVYYGPNHYEAGLVAGRGLGRWAKHRWASETYEVILLGRIMGGSVPNLRMEGLEKGIQEILPDHSYRVIHLRSDGHFEGAMRTVRRHLRFGKPGKVLVGAVNDASALGALRAFEEAGILSDCAVFGQDGTSDARAELRRPGTRLIGTVAYFPENLGPELMTLAAGILGHKPTPNAVFFKHEVLTPANVNHVYPNDSAYASEPSALIQF